jgi:hypothetical protein
MFFSDKSRFYQSFGTHASWGGGTFLKIKIDGFAKSHSPALDGGGLGWGGRCHEIAVGADPRVRPYFTHPLTPSRLRAEAPFIAQARQGRGDYAK